MRVRHLLRETGSLVLSFFAILVSLFALSVFYWTTLARCGTGLLESYAFALVVTPLSLLWSRNLARTWNDMTATFQWSPVTRWAWIIGLGATVSILASPCLLAAIVANSPQP